MKFLVIFAIIGLALAAPPTKEELESRATQLEGELEKYVEEIRTIHPLEARILETEVRELKVLSGELATAKNELVVRVLEVRLNGLEMRVTEQLKRINSKDLTGTPAPVTTAATTAAA